MSDKTFYNIESHDGQDNGYVEEASVYIEFYLENIDTNTGKDFEITADVAVSEFEGDWDRDADEDLNAYIDYFSASEVTGEIIKFTPYKKVMDRILEYAKSRHLIVADETKNPNAEFYTETDFYIENAGKEITEELIMKFFEIADIEDDTIVLCVERIPENREAITFADTEYGDLTGQTFDGDIDVSNYHLKSLEGAPKIINGHFNVEQNIDLKSLEFGPEKVYTINIRRSGIKNLKFLPQIKYPNSNKNNIVSIYTHKDRLELEYKYIQENPNLTFEEIYDLIYSDTDDEYFLTDDLKELFVF